MTPTHDGNEFAPMRCASSTARAEQPHSPAGECRRRELLAVGGVALAGLGATWFARKAAQACAAVFVARGQSYDGPLAKTIRDGLAAVGFDPASVRGRRVLLKPNLVEPSRSSPQMTTHPAMVVAAIEVFRAYGAEVLVGEAPGHVRDTEMALDESGLGAALSEERQPFCDLNYADIQRRPNRGRASRIAEFSFPAEVATADWIVSLPKLKTHHWMGMTAALKNLYGTLPGCVYGWPKNVLHFAGIPQTVVDIAASLPRTIAIVDGIVCMEGDGPILGTAKTLGLVGVGLNATALDATLARIAGFDPARIPYLRLAEGRLGPIAAGAILERGDSWRNVASPLATLDVPHLRAMRAL